MKFKNSKKLIFDNFSKNVYYFKLELINQINNGIIHEFVEEELLPQLKEPNEDGEFEGYATMLGDFLLDEIVNNGSEIDGWFGCIIDYMELAEFINDDIEIDNAMTDMLSMYCTNKYSFEWGCVASEDELSFYIQTA